MAVLSRKLQKFIDKVDGPVLSISSVPYPGFLRRRLWYSTAQLHPKLFLNPAKTAIPLRCGVGWSPDKEESRRKAVVEAIERWAFHTYSVKPPKEAGMHIDTSCNGFAAMPAAGGGRKKAVFNAYCEALERWVLNRFWDVENIFLEKYDLKNKFPGQMLKPVSVEWSCFRISLSSERIVEGVPDALSFCLCLLKTRFGGVIAGSACSVSADSALERAVLEAYLHAVAFEQMVSGRLSATGSIIASRLSHFARLRNGYRIVMEHVKLGKANPLKSPRVLFSKTLAGPWEPEVVVHRVLLSNSKPNIISVNGHRVTVVSC